MQGGEAFGLAALEAQTQQAGETAVGHFTHELLHPLETSLIWCTVLTVVGLSLATWRFTQRSKG